MWEKSEFRKCPFWLRRSGKGLFSFLCTLQRLHVRFISFFLCFVAPFWLSCPLWGEWAFLHCPPVAVSLKRQGGAKRGNSTESIRTIAIFLLLGRKNCPKGQTFVCCSPQESSPSLFCCQWRAKCFSFFYALIWGSFFFCPEGVAN